MNITIGEYQIISDGMCITLLAEKIKKSGNNIGEAYISTVGYYSDLSQALNRLLEERISGSDVINIKILLTDIRKYKTDVLNALKEGRS